MSHQLTAVREDSVGDRLDALLREDGHAAQERERISFDRLAHPFSDRIVLFGAGGLGRRTLANLRRLDLQPLAFADNNSALWNTSIDGIPVYSIAKAAELHGDNAVFVVTIWGSQARDRMSDRIQQLRDRGCKRVVPAGLLFWKFPEVFLPYFPLDLPHKALSCASEIKRAFDLFEDESSRREYVAQVAFRLLLNYDELTYSSESKHYFPPDLIRLRSDEIFVDCGAFDGDSIAEFVDRQSDLFQSIVAFEPDPANRKKLDERLRRYSDSIRNKIHTLPYAVGARTETVSFTSSGTDQSKVGEGASFVECVTLDEALLNSWPSLVKFDIEGAELAAIVGAGKMISRCRPVLAVSAYHEQNHLWRVPLTLAEICEDYKFFLRPHGSEGWDLACYAVPSERVNLH